MTRGLRIGRILGIPVEIDLTWLIIFGLVAFLIADRVIGDIGPDGLWSAVWLVGVLAALLLFASLVAHELAHSVVAQRQGIAVSAISLFIFGGVARMEREPRSPGEEWRMAAAGPLCSLGLAAFFAAVAVWLRLLALEPSLAALATWLAAMNALVAAFNLLPGLPLDGGRLVRAAIWHFGGDLMRATRLASVGGKVTGYGLVAWGLALLALRQYWGILSVLLGWYLVRLASSGLQQARLQRALRGVPVSQVMSPEVATVPAEISVQQLAREYLPREARAAYIVVRGDEVVGRVSVGDFRLVAREDWPTTPVSEIVRPLREDEVVAPDSDSWEAWAQMARADYARLLVVREGRLLGVLRRGDLMGLLRAPEAQT